MTQNVNISRVCLIFFFISSFNSFGVNVILPSTTTGSTVYILPGFYGVAGDVFHLQNNFNAPVGSLSAVTMGGPGTFILDNGFTISQINGGASGVPGLRAVVLGSITI